MPDAAYEVLVVGGGPAGCAAARLLAAWGHDVRLVTRPTAHAPALAESLPPSCRKLWAVLGAQEAIDRAGFVRATGNTVWWGAESRVETFDGGERGWQITDVALSRVLLALAREAGARVDERIVSDEHASAMPAAFCLDCSGRAGVLARARGGRRYESDLRTVALTATWRHRTAWPVPDETHTLIESYTDGWAWSVPIDDGNPVSHVTGRRGGSSAFARSASADRRSLGGGWSDPPARSVAVMVDPRMTDLARGHGARDLYLAELAKTQRFSRILADADLEGRPVGWDASMYSSAQYGGDDWLLVGDAGSFVDPLSSAGVSKALASGWLAAIVTHTCLAHPARRAVALDFYQAREEEVYAGLARQTRQFLGQAASGHTHPFWSSRVAPLEGGFVADDRASGPADLQPDGVRRDPSVHAAFERIRAAPAVAFHASPHVRVESRPAIDGREIVLQRRLVTDELPAGVRYICDVDVVVLLELAPSYTQVPDLFDACTARSGPIALPDFLAALATVVARGWLDF